MKNIFHFLFLSIILFSASSLKAQNGSASIIGRIVAEGGHHLAYTRVIFNIPTSGEYLTVYSDSLGYFRFSNLTANKRGVLIIQPLDDELETVVSNPIRLAPYERIQAIIGLKRKSSTNMSFESGAQIYRFNQSSKRLSNRARSWMGILNYNPLNILKNENSVYHTGANATVMGQIGRVRDVSINGHLVTDEWSLSDQLNNSNTFIHGLLPLGLNQQTVLYNSYHEYDTYGTNIVNTQTYLKYSKKPFAGGRAYSNTSFLNGNNTLRYSSNFYQTVGGRIDGAALNTQLQYQIGIETIYARMKKNTPDFFNATSVPFSAIFKWLSRSNRPLVDFYDNKETDLQFKLFANAEYSYRQFDKINVQLIHNRSSGSLSNLNYQQDNSYRNTDVKKAYTQIGISNVNVLGSISNRINVTYNNMTTENTVPSDFLISVGGDNETYHYNGYQNLPQELVSQSFVVNNRLNYGISKNNIALQIHYKYGTAAITNRPYSIRHHFARVQDITTSETINATMWYNPLYFSTGNHTDETAYSELRLKFDNKFALKRDVILNFGVGLYYYKFLTNPIQTEYLDNTILNNHFFENNVQQSSIPNLDFKFEYFLGTKFYLNDRSTSVDLNATLRVVPPNTGWFSSLVTYHPYQSAKVKVNGLNIKEIDQTFNNLRNKPFSTNNPEQLDVIFAPEKSMVLPRSMQLGFKVTHQFKGLFDMNVGGFYQALNNEIAYKDININYTALNAQVQTAANPIPTYTRKFSNLNEVVSLYNVGKGGESWQLTLGAERIFKERYKVELQYQYGTSKSYTDMISYDMLTQFRQSPVNLGERLNHSFNDPGHRLNIGFQAKYIYKDKLETRVNLNYNLQSGRRFTYVYSDLNGIINSNNMFQTNRIYIPKSKEEINLVPFTNSAGQTVSVDSQWRRLLEQIYNDDYLDGNRGKMSDINGAKLPIQQWLDLKISNTYILTKKNLVTLDLVFHNVLGMISEDLNPLYIAHNNVIPLLNYEGTKQVDGKSVQTFSYRHTNDKIYPKMSDSRYNMGNSGISFNLGITF